ncbi:MAG: hypothetical protein AAFW98_09420, partial [Pseudomonadota bacterium]
MRTAFALFFFVLAAPSVVFIAWIAGSWFWYAAGALWDDPGDLNTWSLAFVLPGGPLILGVAALTLFVVIGLRYIVRGPAGLQGQRGKIVAGLFLALVPAAIAIPMGALVALRGAEPAAILNGVLGSG